MQLREREYLLSVEEFLDPRLHLKINKQQTNLTQISSILLFLLNFFSKYIFIAFSCVCTVWGAHALATMEARGQLARAGSFCHAGPGD